jgi:RNA polymerase sigma-70 factor (ECF subfamily)
VNSSLYTIQLKDLVERFQKGDAQALDELLRRAAGRLERLAGSMLRRYPRVRQFEQTGDVVQEAALSLLPALRQLNFSSTREFYGLVAEHIRRRLLDLARWFSRPGRAPAPLEEAAGEVAQLPATEPEGMGLDYWEAFHEAVVALPADQREVFSLRFYHGWDNPEIADLLQVSTKTVTRIYLRAQAALSTRLGGPPPASAEERA